LVSYNPLVSDGASEEQPEQRRPVTSAEDPVRLVGLHRLVRSTMRSFSDSVAANIDAIFESALGAVGSFCEVDRAYIFRVDADGEHLSNTHEWCADGIRPEIANLQHIPIDVAEPWMEAFDRDDHVYIGLVGALPDDQSDLRAILAEQGIQSLLVAPLRSGGAFHGFIGFDHVRAPAEFSSADLDVLRILADSIAATMSRLAAEERTRHVELVDPLTDLPNRTMFTELIEQSVAQGVARGLAGEPAERDPERRETRPTARAVVGLIDLDRFAQINDAMGFEAGDELLLAVAARLQQSLRPEDHLARVGGDEFAVLIDGADDESSAEAVSGRLVAALAQPVAIGDHLLTVTASMGFSIDDGSFAHGTELISAAEAALREAKKLGGARAVAFDKDNGQRFAERVNVAMFMRSPAGLDGLHVEYQPAVELATGRVLGAEALARWEDSDGRPVSPELFIPIAEESGLIPEVTRRVVAIVLRDLRERLAPLVEEALSVSVNVSATHLNQPGFLDDLGELIAFGETSDPVRLWVELTESGVMVGNETVLHHLDEIAEHGIRVAVDDFGTGYSSFARLRHLPIAGIKVDRSFVSGIQGDQVNQTLVRAQVDIARELGMLLIAEGVEDEAERSTLASLGVAYGQGFGLHRPMDVDRFESLLRDQHTADGG
jgi:diguanylate cyclase (GGDEF)-like protein